MVVSSQKSRALPNAFDGAPLPPKNWDPSAPVGPVTPVAGAHAEPLQARTWLATGSLLETARPCSCVALPVSVAGML
ncbi:MAG: hypothetical protein EBZ74_12030 [Planctomycetia bacterium]|nr:hypothetical protein [Planctomycetia bacterium]